MRLGAGLIRRHRLILRPREAPHSQTIDQRVAAERRSDDAQDYATTLRGGTPDPVARELRETRRELQLLRDRLAPES